MTAVLDDNESAAANVFGDFLGDGKGCKGILPAAENERRTVNAGKIRPAVGARHDGLLLADAGIRTHTPRDGAVSRTQRAIAGRLSSRVRSGTMGVAMSAKVSTWCRHKSASHNNPGSSNKGTGAVIVFGFSFVDYLIRALSSLNSGVPAFINHSKRTISVVTI